jgi:hypothetical protein
MWPIERGAYGALRVGPAVLPHPGKDRPDEVLARLIDERAETAAVIAAAPRMAALLAEIARVTTEHGNGAAQLDSLLSEAIDLSRAVSRGA